MSFPQYPEYKDSGVEWLGEVPAHWEVSRLKFFGELITGITPPSEDLSNYSEAGWPWVRPDDLDDQGAPVQATKFLTDQGWSYCRPVASMSTLVCCIGSIGKLGFTTEVACTNQQITAVQPFYDARFLFYLVYASKPELDLRATGNVLRILNAERLGNVPAVMPPIDESAQIATFLDHETARIDALVEEQQRLIELLKEKRQAVISHAVTKGLEPDVPMKDSGVGWLGKVPAHWGLKRLGDIVEFSQGKAHEPFVDADGEYICVNSRFVSTNGRSVKRCTKNLTPAKKGDVLMVMSDLPNGRALARSFLVEQSDLYAVNQRVCRIRPVAAFSLFLFYLLDRHPSLLFKDDGFNQTHLSGGDFTQLKLYLPPENEQSEIVEYLGSHTSQIDGLLVESHKNVALLKERRSALISAAVTGKIDVRGWQPPVGSSATRELTQTEMV